jgi:hypothetical protein
VTDRNHHFIVWGERSDSGPGRLVARRISPQGRLLDPEPVGLVDGVTSRFHLASGVEGMIALTYGGNQFRAITSQILPVLLSDISARATAEGVELSWTVHVDGFQQFDVWRVEEDAGREHETRVNDRPIYPTLGRMSLVDRGVMNRYALASVRYFIAGMHPSGEVVRFGPVAVGTETASALRLEVTPNPVRSEFTVDFTLAARRATTIDLLDAAGRRIVSEDLGEIGPGRQILGWPPDGGRIESGAYWVRLSSGAESRVIPLRVVR